MAEAEDVITDAARHATIFARDLWRRQRQRRHPDAARPVLLADLAPRLDLLLNAVFGRGFAIRTAQPPAPPTVLARLLLRRERVPAWREAIGATDGTALWLPGALDAALPEATAIERFRMLALRQAMRAVRGSAAATPPDASPLARDLYLLLEAHVADAALLALLPGMAAGLSALRRDALAQRPPLSAFAEPLRVFERPLRALLAAGFEPTVEAHAWSLDCTAAPLVLPAAPAEVWRFAQGVCDAWPDARARQLRGPWLWRDQWSGELRTPIAGFPGAPAGAAANDDDDDDSSAAPRSARLVRRPEVRDAVDGEEDEQQKPGAWMVQTAAPQEKAEDPFGLSRPTDRDSETAADEFADALSELPEARLVSAPGRPKEVLLSDDPPEARAPRAAAATAQQPDANAPASFDYPEWDWRARGYRDPGATVHLLPAVAGPRQWVEATLDARRGMLDEIRRRFELLRAQRVRLYRQLDGDAVDLAAYVESRAQFRAGQPLDQRLYSSERRSRRDLAVLLLVDVSGSTDSQVSASQRIIDVEREALLLVCIALESLRVPYSVQAFSGEGPRRVVVRGVKSFSEHYGDAVAERIAGLEPEHYTRTGAALRHATALLMREPAEHRLLLLLSDGKPNDIDEYEGRYGVEDLRQAVVEARLQGIAPFCLTVDRQAANYLPAVFGPQHYALLQRPERLPTVLLDWLRRLVQS